MVVEERKYDYAEQLVKLVSQELNANISKYKIKDIVDGLYTEIIEHGDFLNNNHKKSDIYIAFKKVLSNINELPDYYKRLKETENEVDSISPNKINFLKNKKMKKASKRFKELCGIIENDEKKQLKNESYQEKEKKQLLKEDLDLGNFDIIKFENDGIGSEKSDEDCDLYKMYTKEKKPKKNI